MGRNDGPQSASSRMGQRIALLEQRLAVAEKLNESYLDLISKLCVEIEQRKAETMREYDRYITWRQRAEEAENA